MSLLADTRVTIRLALGLACVQACEYRDPKPQGEPGFVFEPLAVQDSPDKKPRPIRCQRPGANHLGACSAARCPIAAELEPLVGRNLAETAAQRIGLPPALVDAATAVHKLIAGPGNLGTKQNGQP